MAAPTDLVNLGYGRGQLRAAPAASIFRIDAKLGRPVDSNSAYRDYDEQMKAYNAYRWYLNGGPRAPLALHPDNSWHCKGMALDTDDGPAYGRGMTTQMWRDNGWLFQVQGEPWHGQYYAHLDKYYGQPAGGGSVPLPTPPKDDEMSQAEVNEIKTHVTNETNRAIVETANRVMTFVIPSYIPGASNPSLGKLIRALFSESFTPSQRQAIATGYEPGVKLVRIAKSDSTGSVFALYQGEDGIRYRFKITDPAQLEAIGADVAVIPQAQLWEFGPESGKGHAIETDFVPSHPGEFLGHVKSDATGNVFALYRNGIGGQVRHLVTNPAELEAIGDDVPVMAQTELWSYAPTNQ